MAAGPNGVCGPVVRDHAEQEIKHLQDNVKTVLQVKVVASEIWKSHNHVKGHHVQVRITCF